MIRDFFNMPKILPNFCPFLESDFPQKKIPIAPDKYSLNDLDIKIRKLNEEFTILSKKIKKVRKNVKKSSYFEIAASKETILKYHELNNINRIYYSAFLEKTKSLYYKYAIFNLQYFKLQYESHNIVRKIQILLEKNEKIGFDSERDENLLRDTFYKLLQKKKEMQFLNEEFLEYRLKINKMLFEIKNKKKTFFIKPMIDDAIKRMTKPVVKLYKQIDADYKEEMENPFIFIIRKTDLKGRFTRELIEREYRKYGVTREGRVRTLIGKYAALLYRYRVHRRWHAFAFMDDPETMLMPVLDKCLNNMIQKLLRYSYTTPGFITTVKSYRHNPSIFDFLKPLYFLSSITTPPDSLDFVVYRDLSYNYSDRLSVSEFFSSQTVVKNDEDNAYTYTVDNVDIFNEALKKTYFLESLKYKNISSEGMFNLDDPFFLSYSSLLNHARSHDFYSDIYGSPDKFMEYAGQSPTNVRCRTFKNIETIENILNSYIDSYWEFYHLNNSVRKINKSNIIVRFIRSHVWFLRISDEL